MLHSAILTLYRAERELVLSAVHEQAIAFRLGQSLANAIERPGSKLRVDAEYNRQGKRPKAIVKNGPFGERPDLIIHVRGTNDSNLLAVEIKKAATAVEEDLRRLETLLSDPFRYGDAVLLILGHRPKWQWIGSDMEPIEIVGEQAP